MEMVLRASAVYFFLWIVSRAVGRRELAELSAFELMMLVIIGDLIQQGVTQNDMSVTGAMLAVGTIGCWTVIFSYISFRFKKTKSIIDGIPVVVVLDGKLMSDTLRLERVTDEDVLQAARGEGIDDIAKVRVGLIESDGKFSFIKYDGERVDPPDRRAG
jgi:uncharacterized membrane protein YcaP (DUF421 family)